MTARTALLALLKLAASAGFLWLAFHLVDDRAAITDLRLAAPGWIALALAIFALMTLLLAIRWRMGARGIGGAPEAPLAAWCGLLWIGNGISQVVPGGVSGDAVRIWGLRTRGTPLLRAVETVALDRAVGLAGLAVLGSAGVAILAGPVALATFAAGAAAGCLVAWAGWRWLAATGRAAALRARIAAWAGFALSLRGVAVVLMSAFTHGLNVGIFILLGAAFGLGLDPAICFLAVPAGIFAAALPVTLGGWGVRELALANAFELAGGDPAAALQGSVLFGLFHLGANAPALLMLPWWGPWSRSGAPAGSPGDGSGNALD